MGEFIKTEISGRVLTVTMCRPEVLNSLHAPACHEMADIWDRYIRDDNLWVAIVTGDGDRAFCAGHDLVDDFFDPMPLSGWAGLSHRTDLHKPLIAAVNGLALGGGWEVALFCDVIISDPAARFGLPEPKVGFAALGGGARSLPRHLPYHIAMGLLLTGDTITASEARQWGLVNQIAQPGAVLDCARQWADRMLRCAPQALRMSKQIAGASKLPEMLREPIYQLENELAQRLSKTADVQEGMAAFLAKRAPVWTGN